MEGTRGKSPGPVRGPARTWAGLHLDGTMPGKRFLGRSGVMNARRFPRHLPEDGHVSATP